MKYQVLFPNTSIENKFYKTFSKIHHSFQEEIMQRIESLAAEPRPFGKKPFKKLTAPIQFYQFTAQYRIRIGNYRVLYDIDDTKRIVWILVLRKREEKTYK